MASTEQARRHHEALLTGHDSTLAVTDPDLIEVFDNFAFDEMLQHGGLDSRRRLMVQLAALIAGTGRVFDFLHVTNGVLTGHGIRLYAVAPAPDA